MILKVIFMTMLIFTIFAAPASAKIWNVDNRGLGDFTTIQSAHDNAAVQPGDTLYVHGTLTNYAGATINKQITIIGSGYNPQKIDAFASKINGDITLQEQGLTNPSGSRIVGVSIVGNNNTINIGANINDITIERCKFDHGVGLNSSCNNIVIQNNILNGFIAISNAQNVIITNNIFSSGCYIQNSNQNSVIANNLFVRITNSILNDIDYGTIINNMFVSNTNRLINTNCDYNLITNNLSFYNSGPGQDSLNGGVGNILNNNLLSVNPQFVDYVYGEPFSFDHDYNLQTGSPAIGAGSDGTDIGIFGGINPFSDFILLSGEPTIPTIFFFQTTTGVPQGGTLQVDLKATSPK